MPPPWARLPASRPPYDDGTAAGLVGFCQWLGEQGLVSTHRADQLCLAVRRVLDPDPGWERSEVRRLDVDGLLERLATATKPPLLLSTLNFYSSRFRKAVRLYLAYLDDPVGFHATGMVLTRWRTRTAAAEVSVPAPRDPAAAPMPTIAYPFPPRGSHTIWLRLPADLTRDEARRLAMFIQALATAGSTKAGYSQVGMRSSTGRRWNGWRWRAIMPAAGRSVLSSPQVRRVDTRTAM